MIFFVMEPEAATDAALQIVTVVRNRKITRTTPIDIAVVFVLMQYPLQFIL
jgi:hypothetical protein